MRWLLAVTLALAASVARAETVVLRSGEHPDFSRIVVELGAASEWRFGRVEGGYGLRLARQDVAFDAAAVFDLIPRDRITEVTAGPGALTLAVDCTCHAEAFELRPGVIVIDMKDGAPAAGSAFEAPLEPGEQAPKAAALPTPSRGVSQAEAERLERYWASTKAAGSRDAATAMRPVAAALARPAPLEPDVPPEALLPQIKLPDPRVAEAQTLLLEQLSRAAGQGLVEADLKEPPRTPRQIAAEQALGTAAPAEPAPEAPQPPDVTDHIRITAETSIDRDTFGGQISASKTDAGAECLPDAALDVAAWGDDSAPAQQLSARRQDLIGEFDAASADAVGAMARLYLFLGFGAEARETLRAFNVDVDDDDLLLTMASVMDGDAVPDPGRLRDMAGCDSMAALWSVMAQPGLALTSQVNRNAVIRSFSQLPLDLRRLLGPRLVERFLAAGDPGTAQTLRDAILRAAGDPGGLVRLAQARLDIETDNPGRADAGLLAVVAEDGPGSPEALILLVDERMAQGKPVEPALIETMAALGFEHHGTDLGQRLVRGQILAMASISDFDEAFAELARQKQDGFDLQAHPLEEELFTLLSTASTDAAFLQHVFGNAAALASAELSRPLREDLATRLIGLGFPAEARATLAVPDLAAPQDRVLLGRIALAEQDPKTAMAAIAGLDGAAAAAVRADALGRLAASPGATASAMIGPPEQAAAALVVPQPGASLSPDAGAGEPAPSLPEAVPPLADGTGAAEAEPERPLEAGRALLEESRKTRERLAELLTLPVAKQP